MYVNATCTDSFAQKIIMKVGKLLLTFFLLLFFNFTSKAQQTGVLTGTINDASNGLPLVGATVTISNTLKHTVSDADGKFRISGLGNGTYSIKVSYVGYEIKQIGDIQVSTSESSVININLSSSKNSTLLNVVVQTTARRENLNTLLITRRNSPVVSDAISAEQIRRSPDKNTSDVLKRVSGTTIQENKFVVVRGMNDRYNEAMLNNSLLPSSEPDRKTFAFDIFPSDVVDNITIIKSATPDLPGSFSGGLIQINTKDVPDKNFFSFKTGIGYNTITTGKNYYDYKGGTTDWLGIDDGVRAIPSKFPGTSEYTSGALSLSEKIKYAQMFKNDWAYHEKSSAPVNPTIQLSGGFNLSHNNNYPKFGGIFGITYSSNLRFSEYNRLEYSDYITDTFYKYKDSVYNHSILASGLANFSLKLNPYNKFSFNNIYSINSNDQIVLRSGPNESNGWTDIKANSFYFVSNRIVNTQIGGDHMFPKIKLRIRWNAYYTNLFRNEPDYRRNVYFTTDPSTPYIALISSGTSAATAGAGVRYYADVKDKTKGTNIDISQPFKLFKNEQTLKLGGSYYNDQRVRDSRFFSASINEGGNQDLLYYSLDSIFRPDNFGIKKGHFSLLEFPDLSFHYDGSINNAAGYIMLDNRFTNKVRFVWGVRVENYHETLNTFAPGTSDPIPVKVDTTYLDWLPSANLIFSILPKANLRACFSRTVARPVYRELAPQQFYDFLSNTVFYGNPNLIETHVNNFELRWEHFFPNSQYYSISGFFKKFENPIQQYIVQIGTDSRQVSYKNIPKATNVGVELEARKNFRFISKKLESLVAYANVALIKSKIDTSSSHDSTISTTLEGQSPYVVNASLQYTDIKTNIGISILYNLIGPRLFLIGGDGLKETWEKIHPTFDIKLNKSFLKKGIVELTFADILHKNDIQYRPLILKDNEKYKYNTDIDRLLQTQTFGMNVTLAVGYRF